jgi:hypothetical protein
MDIEILANRLLEYALNENATEYNRQVMADTVHELGRLLAEKNLAENRAERRGKDNAALKAENEKLRAELEQVKAERDALIEDFVDYVTSGVPNPAIFCKNRCDKCTDMRGWCTGKNCKGFYPSVASGQKED